MRPEPRNKKERTEDAHNIVCALIENYLDVGQPFDDYDNRGWSEANAGKTATILREWCEKHRVKARGRT